MVKALKTIILLIIIALLSLFGWAEYKVQSFLRWGDARESGITVLALSGPIADAELEPLNLYTPSHSGKNTTKKEPVTLKEAPAHLIDAILTVEDRRFYSHIGVDFWGIGRALYENISQGRVVQGASTLTQQLAKNIFLTAERSIVRKVLEAAIALILELHMSKDEILELYLNEVYLGQEGRVALHGVGAAAESFFRKHPSKLEPEESALLAGIIQAPSAYSPRRYPERVKERRNFILELMTKEGKIPERELNPLRAKRLTLHKPQFTRRVAPYFGVALEKSLEHFLQEQGLSDKKATVITGMSQELQTCAESAVEDGLEKLEKDFSFLRRKKEPLQAGLVAIEPVSGLIRAWVGGRDYKENQFDHVSLGKRQIGSTVKPFIYLTALDPLLNQYKAGTLRTILPDEPINVPLPNGKVWRPGNADDRYRGRVTFRYALEQSLNLPSVHVVRRVGIPTIQRTLKQFGVHHDPPAVLALALGALDTNLLSLTAAYGALANDGTYVAPRLFDRIVNSDDEVLFRYPFQSRDVADPGAVFLVNDVLRGVINRGTAQRAKLPLDDVYPSGKTGTSQDERDAWFVGFTPRLVAGVWVGYDNNKPVNIGGGRAAAPIWKRFMQCSIPQLDFPEIIRPRNVTRIKIDRLSGRRATKTCPQKNIVYEFYLQHTIPNGSCPLHGGVVASSESERSRDFYEDQKPPKKKTKSFWDRLLGTGD